MNKISNENSVGLIGLGKMGHGIALNLKDKGWNVVVYNRTLSKVEDIKKEGVNGANSLKELVESLKAPRVIWLMLTAGDPTQQTIFGENGLINLLSKGDVIIEGGNSKFTQDAENAIRLSEAGIKYIDVGVSGGPNGARNGACLMIGGEKSTYEYLQRLFKDLSLPDGYQFFEGYGAGHFVKMVHNGIEYGMMQSIAEGFNIMKNSEYNLNLLDVTRIYSTGSVIQSRLVDWLAKGFERYGTDLEEVSGSVGMLGEGYWTVETAEKMKLEVPVIKKSVEFRTESQKKPSYTGKILTTLRNMFGGHELTGKEDFKR